MVIYVENATVKTLSELKIGAHVRLKNGITGVVVGKNSQYGDYFVIDIDGAKDGKFNLVHSTDGNKGHSYYLGKRHWFPFSYLAEII